MSKLKPEWMKTDIPKEAKIKLWLIMKDNPTFDSFQGQVSKYYDEIFTGIGKSKDKYGSISRATYNALKYEIEHMPVEEVKTLPQGLQIRICELRPGLLAEEKTEQLNLARQDETYEETPHKQKIRELASNLITEIRLPWIMASLIIDLKPATIISRDPWGHDLCPPIEVTAKGEIQVELSIRDAEGISLFHQALRRHLETGGFSEVLSSIEIWRQGVADNLVKCHELLNLVRTDLEQAYHTSIPVQDSGQPGIKMDFPITVCADAVEQAAGSRHFADFTYVPEGLNLKFGAFIIYGGSPNEDLKPYEDMHRLLRTKYATYQVTKEIAKQRGELDSIAENIGQALLKFQNMEQLPGCCELCDTRPSQIFDLGTHTPIFPCQAEYGRILKNTKRQTGGLPPGGCINIF